MSILLNIDPYWSSDLTDLIAVVVALSIPIVIAVLVYRHKVNETNKRTQVLLSALEKNAGAVPEEIIKGLNTPKKSLKERLLGKLLWGIFFSLAGLGLIIAAIVEYCAEICGEFDADALAIGLILMAVGAAFLVYYFVGRRTLKKEIEVEEKENNV